MEGWERAAMDQAASDRADPFWSVVKEAESGRRDKQYEPYQLGRRAMSEALVASFRGLLKTQVNHLKLVPAWGREFEFLMHVWPLLEREGRDCTDEATPALLAAIRATPGVQGAIDVIDTYLAQTEQVKPW